MRIKKSFITFLSVFLMTAAFAQDYKKHTVGKGETITQIAQRYKVTPFDIYRLNPDSQVGIKENDVILIPSSAITPGTLQGSNGKNLTHTAKSKETIFSISKQYGITVDQLMKANPSLSAGLKVGQVINIPGGSNANQQTVYDSAPNTSGVTYHTVAAKETKFGIAKRYGITVMELEKSNPAIIPGLQVGYRLTIGGKDVYNNSSEKPKPTVTEIAKPGGSVTEIIRTTKKTAYANYEVKPKETMFSLTKMFGISEEELIRLNPNLKDGVETGMILKVPGKGSIIVESGFDDLTKTISTQKKKQLVMLLPFNADKIQGDTLNSLASRLKKDAFLNMTLDFYSGALMAIDSAKTLGLNVDVKIYDSQESKASSNVESIVQTYKLQDADAVLGPFYQQYAEKVAELLNVDNVPVISPLSKETGKPLSNLYQAMPSADYSKGAMFDYMISKGGNIIVISDPKKAANREFITQNFPTAKFAELTENGGLNSEKLRTLFVSDKPNFVVLDSERTGMILGATNVLLNEMANFQIQLAIIEPNETLDFEEISMKRLTILKMLYPSLIRENTSEEAVVFENEYKKKNKIFPSQYAVRGFDVTFDTLLRLSQDKGFAASANENSTQQVESKFSYARNGAEGYMNKGVFILQYNEDLSVTEAN